MKASSQRRPVANHDESLAKRIGHVSVRSGSERGDCPGERIGSRARRGRARLMPE